MLVNDLPAAVALPLEYVREARADRRACGARLDCENLGARTDERVRTENLNLPVGHMVVRRLHADIVLSPARLHLSVGAVGRVARVEHHGTLRILADYRLDVAGVEIGFGTLRDLRGFRLRERCLFPGLMQLAAAKREQRAA